MATEILPELWIADKNSFNSKEFSCIINCTKHNKDRSQAHLYIDTHVNKFEYNLELLNKLDPLMEYIHDNICKNKSTIIYCEDGRQIAPAIIAAYIIKYGKVSVSKAVRYIKSKYPRAFDPQNNFELALNRFEKNNI